MKSLLIVFSCHHNNTLKIAEVFARVLDAVVNTPQQTNPNDLHRYDLTGFGSGIYDEKHHPSLLDLAENISPVAQRKAFIFSTSGVRWGFPGFHGPLRKKLQSRGYAIIDEFNCLGYNTNSFLKWFGGMNRGRPDARDFQRAEAFARRLLPNKSAQRSNL